MGGWYYDENGNVSIDDTIETTRSVSVGPMPRPHQSWMAFDRGFPPYPRDGKTYTATRTTMPDGTRVEYGTHTGYPAPETVQRYLEDIEWQQRSEIRNAVITFRDGTTPAEVDLTVRAAQAINTALPFEDRMTVRNARRSRTYASGADEVVVGFAPLREWPEDILQGLVASGEITQETDGSYTTAIGGVATYGPDNRAVWINTWNWERHTDSENLGLMVHELIHAVAAFGHVDTHFGNDERQGVYGHEGASIMSFPPGGSNYGNGAVLYPIDRAGLHAAYDSSRDLDARNDTADHFWGKFDGFEVGAIHRDGRINGWAHGDMPHAHLPDRYKSGNATWNGHLFGFTPSAQAITGNTALKINFQSLEGSLQFTQLAHRNTETAWGDGDLSYDVTVRGNSFIQTGGDSGYVTGSFFGADHHGMGGVLDRPDLAAGFGGVRQ